MLEKVKKALRITATAYDSELNALIDAAVATFKTIGIYWATKNNPEPMIERAIITYCRLYFGTPDDFDKMNNALNTQLEMLHLSRHSRSDSPEDY